MTRAPVLLLVLGLLFLGLTPAAGQEAARGLIVAGNSSGEAGIGPLNPLLCTDPNCQLIDSLLYPTLLRIDPQTRTFVPATDTAGLADLWTLDGNTAAFRLRADRTWSDGTPITAYDVYFSYVAAMNDRVSSPDKVRLTSLIRAIAPIDATTLTIVFRTPGCASLDQINLRIVPAHVFDSKFDASAHFDGGDVTAWFDAQPKRDFSALLNSDFNRAPSVTAGPFRFEGREYDQEIRLISADGLRAFKFVDATDPNETVNRFLRGEINLLIDPPYDRWDDLRASQDAAIIERPGDTLYALRLNFADPNHPSGLTDKDGNPVEQVPNPIFTDPVVRRAMQMSIDVPTLIDATVEGHGTPVNGSLAPSSWAFDSAPSPAYDPKAATHLLEAAGWKDINGDGIRECIGCATASKNQRLAFSLDNAVNDSTLASFISQQLRLVGIDANAANVENLADQTFDAALIRDLAGLPDSPDQSAEFTPAGDVLNTGANVGSYRNDALTALFDQARHAPSCDLPTRVSLYAQAQQIVRDDLPLIPLFSPDRMIAVRGDARTLQPFVEEIVP